MDGFLGYNQIKMYPNDKKIWSFVLHLGYIATQWCPLVLKMPKLAIKNYEKDFSRHAALNIWVLCWWLGCKKQKEWRSYKRSPTCFRTSLETSAQDKPLKCFFGVSSSKFLGFAVQKGGVELNPIKVKAILEMLSLKNLRQLRGLQGRLAYIKRFIANLSGKGWPFSRLMKKWVDFVWDQACDDAFQDIKQYLANPPVLAAPVLGKPLIMYTRALDHSLDAMLAQNSDDGKEVALYYLFRILVGVKHNYLPVEKECLALKFAVHNLCHYILSNTIYLVLRVNPSKIWSPKQALSMIG